MADPVIFYASEAMHGLRADKALALEFPQWSRTRLQSAFKRAEVWIDGEPIEQKTKLVEGDCIEVILPEEQALSVSAVAIPLTILYEDESLVVIDKACGMVTHPGHGTGDDTLVHALLHHTNGQLADQAGTLRPGVVHRLDKETTGVMLFAKTNEAYHVLVKAFATRQVKKEYLALVQGVPPRESGSITEGIRRHAVVRTKMQAHPHGRESHTDWSIVQRFEKVTLLNCLLHTGRTHQIRVHLSHIGFPILGDSTYGYRYRESEPGLARARVFLHAHRITLEHPTRKGYKLSLEAPLPDDFQQIIGLLSCD